MSAFAGLLRHDGSPAPRDEVERLARALPQFDGARATIWTGGPAGLTHRLYPITVEDRLERQPWLSRDGGGALVFAGRLDDREALAAQLGIDLVTLRGMADGALCLAAIEQWGDTAPDHLFGGFAFAFWRSREQRLMLCRDPVGERTLYFHRSRDFTAFATTLNALLALAGVPRALNERAVCDLIGENSFDMRHTLYRDIDRVLPGEVVLCDRNGMNMRRYWQPRHRALSLNSHDDYVDAAREQLDRAVARTLRSFAPVASEATGGLDSSGVAATAARLLTPQRLAVYTRVPPAGFQGRETSQTYVDERAKVMALSRLHPNMDLNFVDDAAPHTFDREPVRLFAATGVAVRNVHNLGWFSQLNEHVASAGHRVLLTGGKGNFSIGWDGSHRLHQLVSSGRLLTAAQEMIALRRLTGESLVASLRQFILSPHEPRALRHWRRRRKGLGVGLEHATFIAPDFAREHELLERIERTSAWGRKVKWSNPFDRRAAMMFNAGELPRDFRAQKAALHGFELRNPLGDPRLIEFSLNVPEAHFFRDGRQRALQRDTIADRVPPEIYNNYKHGEQTPEWFGRMTERREAILADIEQIATSPLAARAIDVDGLRKAAQNWPADALAARSAGLKFRVGVARAVHIGNFIRWFEGGNG